MNIIEVKRGNARLRRRLSTLFYDFEDDNTPVAPEDITPTDKITEIGITKDQLAEVLDLENSVIDGIWEHLTKIIT